MTDETYTTRCIQCRNIFIIPHYIFSGENTFEATVKCLYCGTEKTVENPWEKLNNRCSECEEVADLKSIIKGIKELLDV